MILDIDKVSSAAPLKRRRANPRHPSPQTHIRRACAQFTHSRLPRNRHHPDSATSLRILA